MHKYRKEKPIPRLIRVADCHGDDLTPPRLVQELLDADARMTGQQKPRTRFERRDDLQAVKRPLDAPMATYISELPDPLAGIAWEAKGGYDVPTQPHDWRLVTDICMILMAFGLGVLVGGLL